jgi:hypothetical protein
MMNTGLTFGGHQVNLVNVIEDDVFFEVKGTVGSLKQIKDFLINRNKNNIKKDFFLGNVKILEKGKGNIKLDCIDGKVEELKKARKYGEEIISDAVKDEDLAYKIFDMLDDNLYQMTDKLEGFKDRMQSKLDAKNQTYSIKYEIVGFQSEILVALFRAMSKLYKDRSFLETEKGQSGDLYPEIIKLELPGGERMSIPVGKMRLPGMSRNAYIETQYISQNFCLRLTGQIQKKFEDVIDNIVDETIKELKENSIYKNRVLHIPFHDSYTLPVEEPNFIDVNALKRTLPLILSEEVKAGILNIVGRIKDPGGCQKDGIDIKSTFLLSGIGGTGLKQKPCLEKLLQ